MLSLLLLATVGQLAFAVPPSTPDLPDLVEKILPCVVNVSSTTVEHFRVFGMDDFMNLWGVPQERKRTSLGSGFLIDKDGFLLTNYHVVEQSSEVMVTLLDKRQFRAKIIGKDQKLDLALLQLRDGFKAPAGLEPVSFGNSDTVRIAESVFAVGNPFGLQHTVTMGIISAKDRTIGAGPFDDFLQTDASINPGNSGGPLFNLKGEVVGINTMIYSQVGQSGGVGFAIPVNEAKKIIPDLKRYGRVPRPWLGVLAEQMSRPLQDYYGLSANEGVLIDNLVQDGPAELAGLKTGDIIVIMDGAAMKEPYDVERALAKHKPTGDAILEVRRGKRKIEVRIKLTELPRLDNLPKGII